MINHRINQWIWLDVRSSKAMEGIYSDLQEDAEKVESHFAPAGQRSYLKCCKGSMSMHVEKTPVRASNGVRV